LNERPTADSTRKEIRRQQIVDTARRLYAEKGLEHTSVSDIAEEVGITRTLFYHYFSNKEEVTDTILEGYTSDTVERCKRWCSTVDHSAPLEAIIIDGIQNLLRGTLFNNEGFRKDLRLRQNAVLYQQYFLNACSAVAHYFTDAAVANGGTVASSFLGLEYPYESFYVMLAGIVAAIRKNPELPDEILCAIIIDSLHLQHGQTVCAERTDQDA
jgi:AcrR family transcriptional regulator